MGLRLVGVELVNFRSHEHYEFTPSSHGITTISGANGRGKSTVVNAIGWALYGIKPDGVKTHMAMYREGAQWPKDKCRVRVEAVVGPRRLVVERRIATKAGSCECDVWEGDAEATEDGSMEGMEHVAGPAVTHAAPYIARALGMDAQGFLAAVLVQQKQVDGLLSSKDRGPVLQALLGITPTTEALKLSRGEVNALRKSSQSLYVDSEAVKRAEEAEAEARKALDVIGARIAKGVGVVEDADSKKLRAAEKHAAANSAYLAQERIRQETARINALIGAADAEREQQEKRAVGLAERLGPVGGVIPADKAVRRLSDAKNRAADLEREIASVQQEAQEHDRAFAVIEEARVVGGVRHTVDSAADAAEAAGARADSADEKATVARAREAALRADAQRLDKAAAALRGAVDAHCPTCGQRVGDAGSLAKDLEVQAARARISATEAARDAEEARVESEKAAGERDALREVAGMLASAPDHAGLAQEARNRVEELSASRERAESELAEAEAAWRSVDEHNQRARELAAARARVIELSEVRESLLAELRGVEESAKSGLAAGRRVTPEALASLASKSEEARAAWDRVRDLLASLREEQGRAEGELKARGQALASVRADMAKYQGVLESIEVASHAARVVAEFREEWIASAVPQIEARASAMLSQFTGGEFTGLRLDPKFNASVVTRGGVERPVGALSGGELSAAAMALRLAVSMMLAGDDGGSLIVLDEVLVSQDAERSEAMLNVIRDTCKGQVVLIAHSPVVADVSDQIVSL